MADFLIRNIDQELLERLHTRAAKHGRSLQGEIHSILRNSVRLSRAESIALLDRIRDQLPHFDDDSTPLIREDRDSR